MYSITGQKGADASEFLHLKKNSLGEIADRHDQMRNRLHLMIAQRS